MPKIKIKSPVTKCFAVVVLLAVVLSVSFWSPVLNRTLSEQAIAATEPSLAPTTSAEETVAPQLAESIALNRSMDEIILTGSLAAGLNAAPAGPIFTDVNYVLYISANRLTLRAEPSAAADSLAQLNFGDKVVCVGENDQWMKVRYNDATGYLKTEYTSKTMVFSSVNETMYVKSNTLNLRSAPSEDSAILAKLLKNNALTRTGIGDQWSKVVTAAGKTGYVSSKYLASYQTDLIDSIPYSSRDYSNISQAEMDLFTRIISLESSSRFGYKGYLSVASVILNRVESSRFPNTITGVVSSPNQFTVYTSTRKPADNDNLRRAVKDALAGKRNLPGYVMYFIASSHYQLNVANNGSFGKLKIYGIAYDTVWCYKSSDR